MMYPKGSKQPRQVWAAVMNVYKEPPSTTPPVTPSPTPTSTQTPTPSITPTQTITPTNTNTPTPSITPSSTPPAPLLLDTYSGASMAYSVRKLRNGYTGNAIRVRRSSDNAEQNIGFSGNNLDTSALLAFCSGTTNGFVTTWYDQSGNGNNAVMTTAVNQPQIVSSGAVLTLTGIGSARPILRFDGVNDSMALTSPVTTDVFTSVYPMKKASADFGPWFAGSSNNQTPFTPVIAGTGGTFISNQPMTTYNASYNNTNYIILSGTKPTGNGSGVIRVNDTLIPSLLDLAFITGNNIFTQINQRGTIDQSKCDVPEMVFWATNIVGSLTGINTNVNTYYQIY